MKDLITKIDFFSGLDDKIIRKIADACIMRQFTRNETIVRQGEMGLGLYIIAKGHVRVDREQAGVRMQVAELGPEQFFGEMSLLDNKPRSATVTGIEETECLLLTRDSFVKLMNKYPEIPIRMARVLAERIRVANEKLAAAPPPAAVPAAAPGAPAVPVTPAAAAPSPNGAVPATPASAAEGNGTKAQIHGKLLEAFDRLYTLKALSRFSVAVLGCPVEGAAANVVDQIRIGDVKALIFPADERVDMQIAAREPGDFTLHVFTPSALKPYRFGPVPVDANDSVRLSLGPGSIRLRKGGRTIPFL
jgi:CRP/FNR family cyclic AMP-dependent transcriptional regulator